MRGLQARRCLLPALALLTLSCATSTPRQCTIAVLDGAAGRPEVQGSCRVLAGEKLLALLPPGTASLDGEQRTRLLAAALSAANGYYDDPQAGRRLLEEHLQDYQQMPALLPTSPGERARLYQALTVLLLARYNESQESGDAMAVWLARHLPDQVPTPRQLPPKLSARAAQALQQAHADKTTISVGQPPDCPSATLYVDGRAMGTLPLQDLPVHVGTHAVWAACGETLSWVRTRQLESATELAGPRILDEAAFLRTTDGLWPERSVENASRTNADLRLLAALGTDALLLPQEQVATLVTPVRQLVLEPGANGHFLVHEESLVKRDWKRPTKWILTGVAAAALGAGIGLHAAHDRTIDEMARGTVDNRARADSLQAGALAGYGSAAAAATGAVLLFVLDALPPPEYAPLF